MSCKTDPALVQQFVERYLRAIGVPPQWSGDLLKAELSPEQAAEVDGPRSRLNLLVMAFDEEVAQRYPEAELMIPGSFRLDRMITSAMRRGGLGRQYAIWKHSTAALPTKAQRFLPPRTREFVVLGGDLVYLPLILYRFKITYIGTEKNEKLSNVAVSLLDGRTIGLRLDDMNGFVLSDERAEYPTLKRRLSYKQSYKEATAHLLTHVQQEEHDWAEPAFKGYEAEVAHLRNYFADRAREEPETDLNDEEKRRLKEAEYRLRPKVIAKPYSASLLYVTGVNYRVTLLTEGKRLDILYNPLTDEVIQAG